MNEVIVAPLELKDAAHEAIVGDPLIKRNLALHGHVTVRLSVVLGSAEMNVEKLFTISKGETIALGADLDAPVTLQLDNKPIARGQLVAVDDCFGLKITEIL